MKRFVINCIGYIIELCYRIFCRYQVNKTCAKFGAFGEKSMLAYPFLIQGEKNIYIGKNCSIRQNSVFTAINAKIIIKDWVITATDLIISTGNHRVILGRFIGSITNTEKGKGYDADVIINEDVWIASRVTILKGVNVGRGAIIAAGAVVNRDVLPYSVVGGVPAKFIKFKWSLEQVLEHEQKLYKEDERFSVEELKSFGLK